MTPALRNIVRTAVPAIVGALVTLATKQAAHLDPTIQMIVFPIATTAYYAGVRLLEERYPKLSWLIGALPSLPDPVQTQGK